MSNKIRFAILARVSTESQEKEGKSLEVQTKTLRECVERLNGIVVKEYFVLAHSVDDKDLPEDILSLMK